MNRSENKHLVLKAFEGPTWYHHVVFPCNQSQACGIAVVVSVLVVGVIIARPPARRSLFLFSDRSDNAGDGSDARTMATVTKEEEEGDLGWFCCCRAA